jgi:hypothetical protein
MSSPAKQLGSAEKLPDGTVIRLRLIGPEDEVLQNLAAHMSPRSCGYASSWRCED